MTGAASGIGAACARAARRHASTCSLLADVNEAGGHRVAALRLSGRGTRCEPVVVDVTDAAACKRLAARAQDAGNCAASRTSPGISPTMGDWRRILDVDLVGTRG